MFSLHLLLSTRRGHITSSTALQAFTRCNYVNKLLKDVMHETNLNHVFSISCVVITIIIIIITVDLYSTFLQETSNMCSYDKRRRSLDGIWKWIATKPSTRTHTHAHLMALFPRLPGWASTRKAKPMWILLKQETVSGSGISWAICKSAPRSRQITMPAPYHSVFYRPDALPATQPTASKHWRHFIYNDFFIKTMSTRILSA